jgi:outer membrane receptor protein involved in Fe transport
VLIGIGLAGGANAISAQNPSRPAGAQPQLAAGNGEVRGTVLDGASGAPINRASIAVRSNPGKTLVAGALAGADGAFRVQGLRPGAYTLRMTYLGFGPKLQDVTITDAAPIVNIGSVKLSHVAAALAGVAVTEERATVAIEPDRNAYRAKDVAPAAGNAAEVLDAVPAVQVDQDGKVSLRGNENVAVQINGRPSPIRGPQLGSYLKSLPASIVERIEVIPNPSAKEDPEGMAGIINIVLKQNTDLGVSGGLNVGAANRNRYNGSGNLGYQSGAITTFTNLGITSDRRTILGINNRERIDALRAPLSFTEQGIDGNTGYHGQNLNASVDYKLTARDVLSNAVTFSHRSNADASSNAYVELNNVRAQLDSYDRLQQLDSKGTFVDYDVALKRTFEPRKHELSAEVRVNRSHDQDNTTLWRLPTAVPGATRLEGELDDVDAIAKQAIAQVDYTKTLADRTKLETGVKSNARWLDRDYAVTKDVLGDGNWVPSNLSNAFTFDERVQAVYGVLSKGVGKVDFQAGLRGEYASRNFNLASTGQSFPYIYRSLFPSGSIMFNKSEATQMKLSYSRRVRRPGTQELNPFPYFFDVQNVFIGNPSLNPEYTDAIELGLTRNYPLGTLQISPFYRYTKNVIRVIINTADQIDGREVTTVNFKNLASSNSWGSDVNGSLRLGPKFNGFASFNIFRMVTDGGSTSAVGSDAVTWSTRVNGTSNLSPTVLVQASYFYRAPMKIERGEFAAMQMANFTIKKKLDGDNKTVSLRVNDPFRTMRFRVLAGNDNVTQLTERNFGIRSVFLTFQYNYGQAPKIRPQQQQQPEAPAPSFP